MNRKVVSAVLILALLSVVSFAESARLKSALGDLQKTTNDLFFSMIVTAIIVLLVLIILAYIAIKMFGGQKGTEEQKGSEAG